MKKKTTKPKTDIVQGDPRGVFCDLFDAHEAADLTMRAELLRGLQAWITTAGTQAEAAHVLGVTQSRVSDIKRGKIDSFSIDLLIRLAARAGLHPQLHLAA
jgi:predicted XRE-type DNA-binding protein